MVRICVALAALAGFGLCICDAADAPTPAHELAGWSFSVIEENDLFLDTDQDYTQGARLNLLWPEAGAREGGTMDWLPDWGFETTARRFGIGLGQNIYTPADLTNTAPIPNDRPYAGWLYVAAILQRRGTSAGGGTTHFESLEAEFGVVGPWSLAEQAQTWVHEVRGFTIPQGWDNQLENEPGVRLKLMRALRWRIDFGGGLATDVIPHLGVSLGNVETSGRMGGQMRLGFNLPDNFGQKTIDALSTTAGGYDPGWKHWFGFYAFAGAEGRAVAHNIFLDGSLFHSGPSVDKEWLVGDFRFGGAVVFRWFEIGYTQTHRTKEFRTQTQPHRFGSLYFQMKF